MKSKNTNTTVKAKQTWFTQGLLPVAFMAMSLLAAAPAIAADCPGHQAGPPGTLAEWQDLYWRWYYGGITLPIDANGNAVTHNVVLMPIPDAPGDGTPGHVDVTLNAGQAWVLPLWALIGTSYSDGTPPDTFVGRSVFKMLDISFQVDGKTLISSRNVMDYFSRATFDPPVPYVYLPLALTALIWFEDIGLVHAPLSVGTHTLKLDVKSPQPGFAEYHNTWSVTVEAEKGKGHDKGGH